MNVHSCKGRVKSWKSSDSHDSRAAVIPARITRSALYGIVYENCTRCIASRILDYENFMQQLYKNRTTVTNRTQLLLLAVSRSWK
jgi:hypothetical protein